MPKRGKYYGAQLSFGAEPETRQALRALAYMRGSAEYAVVARELLKEAVQARVEGMTGKERAQYDTILDRVKLQEATLKDIKQLPKRAGSGQ